MAAMKPGHAAALALVGWYLMVPPLDRQRRIVIRQHQVKVCDI
jgi:hypothetical protein